MGLFHVLINAVARQAPVPVPPSPVIAPLSTVPATILINIVQGKPAVRAGPDLPVRADDLVIDLSHRTLGDAGKIAAEVYTLGKRHHVEVEAQTMAAFKDILEGKNPMESFAIPLAAAIAVSASEYRVSAKPVPAHIRARMAPYYPANVLERAKYGIGSLGINLPDAIINARKFFAGEEYAVTVDDVIVFPKMPNDDQTGLLWWAHELEHVSQYTRWGVNTFAYRYITGWNEVESEAVQKADEVLAKLGR